MKAILALLHWIVYIRDDENEWSGGSGLPVLILEEIDRGGNMHCYNLLAKFHALSVLVRGQKDTNETLYFLMLLLTKITLVDSTTSASVGNEAAKENAQ